MKRKQNFSVIGFFILMLGIFNLFSVSDSGSDGGDDFKGADLRDGLHIIGFY